MMELLDVGLIEIDVKFLVPFSRMVDSSRVDLLGTMVHTGRCLSQYFKIYNLLSYDLMIR